MRKTISFENVQNFIRKFMYSDRYVMFICALAYLSWAFNVTLMGLILMAIIASLTLIFSNDALPCAIPIYMCWFSLRSLQVTHLWLLILIILPVAVSFFIFLIRNKPKKLVLGKFFLPLLAISIALLVGGFYTATTQEFLISLPNVFGVGFLMLALYFVLMNYVNKEKLQENKLTFAKFLAYMGLVICLEMVTMLILDSKVLRASGFYWSFAWGSKNTIAYFFGFSAPMCLYLSIKSFKLREFYFGMGILQYIFLIFSFSRGGIIFGLIQMVVALVFWFIKCKNTKRNWIVFGVAIAVLVAVLLIFRDAVALSINRFLSIQINGIEQGSSGRIELYNYAWQEFLSNPIFGGGIGHSFTDHTVKLYGPVWYHSTIMEVIGSMGLVGVGCYAFFYYKRFEICCANIKNSDFSLFTLIVWISYEGYSLIDVGLFVPLFLVLLIFQMVYMELSNQKLLLSRLIDEKN